MPQKVEIKLFIEGKYDYYDEQEGGYTGDKYSNAIMEEASEKYDLTLWQVSSIWGDETIQADVQESELNVADEQGKKDFEFLKLMRDTASDKMKTVIKGKAQEEWGTDYNMVKYEYDKQLEAYVLVMEIVNHPDLEGTVNEVLMDEALNEWGLDFNMVMYEYDKQLEAWKELQNN